MLNKTESWAEIIFYNTFKVVILSNIDETFRDARREQDA